jgi:hypothetical protein
MTRLAVENWLRYRVGSEPMDRKSLASSRMGLMRKRTLTVNPVSPETNPHGWQKPLKYSDATFSQGR